MSICGIGIIIGHSVGIGDGVGDVPVSEILLAVPAFPLGKGGFCPVCHGLVVILRQLRNVGHGTVGQALQMRKW